MKKFIIFVNIFCMLICSCVIFADAAFTNAFVTKSDIVYMTSLDNDSTVIYEKNADLVVNPSALTKIVTAMLVIEKCDDLNTLITVPSEPIRALDDVDCTRVGILVGEIISVRELLYCMMIANACDAGNVLAYHFGGNNTDAFVAEMNAYAKKVGCQNTNFLDPNGLFVAQTSTAKDIALLYKSCLDNDFFTQLVSMTYYDMPATNSYDEPRYLRTTNLCLNGAYEDYYIPAMSHGKAGTDNNDKCSLVSVATKDGYTYLCVVLNADTFDEDEDGYLENLAMIDSKDLYEWAFEHVRLRVVADTTRVVTEIKVNHSDQFDYVSLVPMTQISALVPEGIDEETCYITVVDELTKKEIDAPVHKGDVLGVASIQYAGEEIARVDLVASFDVERNYARYIGDTIISILTSKIFISIIAILVIAAIVLIVVFIFVKPTMYRGRNIRIIKGYEVIESNNPKNKANHKKKSEKEKKQ